MYDLSLTLEEFQTLINLIDLGVRAAGFEAVNEHTLAIKEKLEEAEETAEKENKKENATGFSHRN